MAWKYNSFQTLKELIYSTLNGIVLNRENQFEEFAASVVESIPFGKPCVELLINKRVFERDTHEDEITKWQDNMLQRDDKSNAPFIKFTTEFGPYLISVVIYTNFYYQDYDEASFMYGNYLYIGDGQECKTTYKYNSYEELGNYIYYILKSTVYGYCQNEKVVNSVISNITEGTPNVEVLVYTQIFERGSERIIEKWQNDILKCANPDAKIIRVTLDYGNPATVEGVVIELLIDHNSTDALLQYVNCSNI